MFVWRGIYLNFMFWGFLFIFISLDIAEVEFSFVLSFGLQYNIDSQQNTHVWNKPDKNYACIHFLNQHKRERNKILMENCLQN